MLTITFRNVGGSVMMAVPKAVLDGFGIAANSKADLLIEPDGIKIRPRKRPKYTLEELLAQCDPSIPPHDDEILWDRMEPVGREIVE